MLDILAERIAEAMTAHRVSVAFWLGAIGMMSFMLVGLLQALDEPADAPASVREAN